MMKTVLVTGGAGFIGRFAARAFFQAGYRVIALGRETWGTETYHKYGISSWYTCDVSTKTLTTYGLEADAIIHCAGSGSVARSLVDPRGDFDSNVGTTIDVLEFARYRKNTKVVILSSAGVYGTARTMPIRIDAAQNPISPYGFNKSACELLARQYGTCFGIDVAIVRLFSVYGEHLRKQLLWDTANKFDSGDYNFFGTGEETRDWIHIEDATRLLVVAATIASPKAPVINGGCGKSTRIREVIETLAHYLGVVQPIHFTGEVREGDPTHYQADITEALATGWRPCIALAEGLARYAKWYRLDTAIY